MFKYLTFAFILFLGLVCKAKPYCESPLPANGTYKNLKDKIQLCNILRIEDLVPLLSEAHRSNYTLMHHSQSLQHLDEMGVLFPRAILYGDDAKLILTFNGDPKQEHYENLEIMTFSDDTKSFETRDIEFPEKKAGQVIFSKANPKRVDIDCATCHYNDIRPSWSTYPLWPGAFGGEDDSVYRPVHFSGVDEANYKEFLKNGKSKGRYKSLAPRQSAALPNTRFAELLHNLNMQKIARGIAQTSSLQHFKYALLGALTCFYSDHFNEIEGFIPQTLLKTKFKKSYSTLYDDTAKANRTSFFERIEYLKALYPEAPEESKVKEIKEAYEGNPNGLGLVSDHIVTALRFIVENLGGSMSEWSMEILPGSYDFENGYVGITSLKDPLAVEVLSQTKSDRALKDRLKTIDPGSPLLEPLCRDLQSLSLNELKAI